MVCLKRPKINEKEARVGSFFNKRVWTKTLENQAVALKVTAPTFVAWRAL